MNGTAMFKSEKDEITNFSGKMNEIIFTLLEIKTCLLFIKSNKKSKKK